MCVDLKSCCGRLVTLHILLALLLLPLKTYGKTLGRLLPRNLRLMPPLMRLFLLLACWRAFWHRPGSTWMCFLLQCARKGFKHGSLGSRIVGAITCARSASGAKVVLLPLYLCCKEMTGLTRGISTRSTGLSGKHGTLFFACTNPSLNRTGVLLSSGFKLVSNWCRWKSRTSQEVSCSSVCQRCLVPVLLAWMVGAYGSSESFPSPFLTCWHASSIWSNPQGAGPFLCSVRW